MLFFLLSCVLRLFSMGSFRRSNSVEDKRTATTQIHKCLTTISGVLMPPLWDASPLLVSNHRRTVDEVVRLVAVGFAVTATGIVSGFFEYEAH